MKISEKLAKNFLYLLLKIRIVDEYIADIYPSDVIKCPIHLSIGSEAVAVGTCCSLRKKDFVIGGHRSHGIYLAKNAPLNEFMAEMYGKITGCSGGKGGSMHLTSKEFGLLGSTPILGATIPIGVGSALASKLKKTNEVTMIFFGDGASEEGTFYESLNLAALLKLPAIFVCENNRYSIYQKQEIRQPLDNLHKKGEVFGIPGTRVDGNNVIDVYGASLVAIKHAQTKGPYLLECMTNRWRQHVGPYYDHETGFGTQAEIKSIMMEQDPIKLLIKQAKTNKWFDQEFVNQTKKKINKELQESLEFANSSQLPNKEELFTNIY